MILTELLLACSFSPISVMDWAGGSEMSNTSRVRPDMRHTELLEKQADIFDKVDFFEQLTGGQIYLFLPQGISWSILRRFEVLKKLNIRKIGARSSVDWATPSPVLLCLN